MCGSSSCCKMKLIPISHCLEVIACLFSIDADHPLYHYQSISPRHYIYLPAWWCWAGIYHLFMSSAPQLNGKQIALILCFSTSLVLKVLLHCFSWTYLHTLMAELSCSWPNSPGETGLQYLALGHLDMCQKEPGIKPPIQQLVNKLFTSWATATPSSGLYILHLFLKKKTLNT